MSVANQRPEAPTAIRTDLGAYVDDPLLARVFGSDLIGSLACICSACCGAHK